MHIARLKQKDLGRSDFTCIRIVPVHRFMKKSDYSCTVTNARTAVHKIQKDSTLTFSLILSTEICACILGGRELCSARI